MDRDTVVALSTPPGASGIAVIRISGSEAVDILDTLAPGAAKWISHKLYRRVLNDGNDEPLDEVLAVVMRAPDSYTGEDVVEISCHGSMQVVSEIIEEILRGGARGAGPGEFTKRAFLNGRLDLVQAEAVADLISAETKLQRRVAIEHLEGGLSKKVQEIEKALLEQLALVEVSIDFCEEDIETYSSGALGSAAAGLRETIRHLIDSEIAGGKLRNGIRVTILGARNAGKSSIYNALLGEERAIVSAIPGTTRDILRERIHIGGFTYCLEDTAGIADTGCEIEAKGISIGREAAGRADLVLFVIDGSIELGDESKNELQRLGPRKPLCVLNKCDLGLAVSVEQAREFLGTGAVTEVSALTGEGLEELRQLILHNSIQSETEEMSRERIAVNARQAAALREADEALSRLEVVVDEGAPAEILSVELRAAADACGKVTGRSIVENLLDAIFTTFCIGK